VVAITPLKLNPLASYSPEQLAQARQLSPAADRYLSLLEIPAKDFNQRLRQRRHRAWLECVFATLFKTQSCEEVCKYWSLETKAILTECWNHHALNTTDICLVAMGKLAAEELNLSSDIDIIFISEEEPSKNTLRKVRAFLHSLTDVSFFGFCYRVDLDLRPGGSSSSLVTSFEQMTNHYGYQGETWERVALVRLIPLLGNVSLGQRAENFCRKFAFRKHIDYTLLNDLFSMREKIQNAQPLSYKKNLKFSRGGIRDLELFIHSLLLIHGGKKPSLITRFTGEAIDHLLSAQILNEKDANFLKNTYWFYRRVENHIHLYEDQHTYELPLHGTALISDLDLNEFKEKSQIVTQFVDQFLAPHAKLNPLISEEELEYKFSQMNITSPDIDEAWEKLLHSEARSKEKQRDENERRRFLNSALDNIHAHGLDKELAILNLSRFLLSIKAKTSFFALFNQHQELITELAWIFSCSPYLSQILIHRPEISDSFISKSFEIDRTEESAFYNSLQDYKLLSDLASSSAFLRNRRLDLLIKNVSDTTDTVVKELLENLSKKTQQHLDILTLGKWAGREMGLKSDLDFVFVTKESPQEGHFKLARRFINFLQSPGSGQTLYHIDLRLRPTGHAGPLLISIGELKDYLENKSKVWERQAYLNHRFLLGSFTQNPTEPLFSPRPISGDEKMALLDIQNKLLLTIHDQIDLKKSLGGLIHTEFILQIRLLKEGLFPQLCSVAGMIKTLIPHADRDLCERIHSNYTTLRTYQQLLILLSDSPSQQFAVSNESFRKLGTILKIPSEKLFQEIKTTLVEQQGLLKDLDA
jgi:[glutamine synthetase] adenylyltransferase / [glutamine synthetase]-adenylyl-L-tyrosine phosphorylase